jgi:hypothetical protein
MLTLVAWCLAALLVSLVVGLVIVRWMPLTAPSRAANEPSQALGEEPRGAAQPGPVRAERASTADEQASVEARRSTTVQRP